MNSKSMEAESEELAEAECLVCPSMKEYSFHLSQMILKNKYEDQFIFFYAKPINQILANFSVEHVCKFKQNLYLDDENEYFKRFYFKNEISNRMNSLLTFYINVFPDPHPSLFLLQNSREMMIRNEKIDEIFFVKLEQDRQKLKPPTTQRENPNQQQQGQMQEEQKRSKEDTGSQKQSDSNQNIQAGGTENQQELDPYKRKLYAGNLEDLVPSSLDINNEESKEAGDQQQDQLEGNVLQQQGAGQQATEGSSKNRLAKKKEFSEILNDEQLYDDEEKRGNNNNNGGGEGDEDDEDGCGGEEQPEVHDNFLDQLQRYNSHVSFDTTLHDIYSPRFTSEEDLDELDLQQQLRGQRFDRQLGQKYQFENEDQRNQIFIRNFILENDFFSDEEIVENVNDNTKRSQQNQTKESVFIDDDDTSNQNSQRQFNQSIARETESQHQNTQNNAQNNSEQYCVQNNYNISQSIANNSVNKNNSLNKTNKSQNSNHTNRSQNQNIDEIQQIEFLQQQLNNGSNQEEKSQQKYLTDRNNHSSQKAFERLKTEYPQGANSEMGQYINSQSNLSMEAGNSSYQRSSQSSKQLHQDKFANSNGKNNQYEEQEVYRQARLESQERQNRDIPQSSQHSNKQQNMNAASNRLDRQLNFNQEQIPVSNDANNDSNDRDLWLLNTQQLINEQVITGTTNPQLDQYQVPSQKGAFAKEKSLKGIKEKAQLNNESSQNKNGQAGNQQEDGNYNGETDDARGDHLKGKNKIFSQLNQKLISKKIQDPQGVGRSSNSNNNTNATSSNNNTNSNIPTNIQTFSNQNSLVNLNSKKPQSHFLSSQNTLTLTNKLSFESELSKVKQNQYPFTKSNTNTYEGPTHEPPGREYPLQNNNFMENEATAQFLSLQSSAYGGANAKLLNQEKLIQKTAKSALNSSEKPKITSSSTSQLRGGIHDGANTLDHNKLFQKSSNNIPHYNMNNVNQGNPGIVRNIGNQRQNPNNQSERDSMAPSNAKIQSDNSIEELAKINKLQQITMPIQQTSFRGGQAERTSHQPTEQQLQQQYNPAEDLMRIKMINKLKKNGDQEDMMMYANAQFYENLGIHHPTSSNLSNSIGPTLFSSNKFNFAHDQPRHQILHPSLSPKSTYKMKDGSSQGNKKKPYLRANDSEATLAHQHQARMNQIKRIYNNSVNLNVNSGATQQPLSNRVLTTSNNSSPVTSKDAKNFRAIHEINTNNNGNYQYNFNQNLNQKTAGSNSFNTNGFNKFPNNSNLYNYENSGGEESQFQFQASSMPETMLYAPITHQTVQEIEDGQQYSNRGEAINFNQSKKSFGSYLQNQAGNAVGQVGIPTDYNQFLISQKQMQEDHYRRQEEEQMIARNLMIASNESLGQQSPPLYSRKNHLSSSPHTANSTVALKKGVTHDVLLNNQQNISIQTTLNARQIKQEINEILMYSNSPEHNLHPEALNSRRPLQNSSDSGRQILANSSRSRDGKDATTLNTENSNYFGKNFKGFPFAQPERPMRKLPPGVARRISNDSESGIDFLTNRSNNPNFSNSHNNINYNSRSTNFIDSTENPYKLKDQQPINNNLNNNFNSNSNNSNTSTTTNNNNNINNNINTNNNINNNINNNYSNNGNQHQIPLNNNYSNGDDQIGNNGQVVNGQIKVKNNNGGSLAPPNRSNINYVNIVSQNIRSQDSKGKLDIKSKHQQVLSTSINSSQSQRLNTQNSIEREKIQNTKEQTLEKFIQQSGCSLEKLMQSKFLKDQLSTFDGNSTSEGVNNHVNSVNNLSQNKIMNK